MAYFYGNVVDAVKRGIDTINLRTNTEIPTLREENNPILNQNVTLATLSELSTMDIQGDGNVLISVITDKNNRNVGLKIEGRGVGNEMNQPPLYEYNKTLAINQYAAEHIIDEKAILKDSIIDCGVIYK